MVSFCNRSDINSLAGSLLLWAGRLLFASITGTGGKGIYRRVSDIDGTFSGDIIGSIYRAAAWYFTGICDGGIDGSVRAIV